VKIIFNANLPDLSNVRFKDDADTIAEELYDAALIYQQKLDTEHEVGAMLASFGQTVQISITGIGHVGKKLIKFTGVLVGNGSPVELLQHVSQISFLLVSVPKENPEEPKRQIGFIQE
jgi:hypothetical protein